MNRYWSGLRRLLPRSGIRSPGAVLFGIGLSLALGLYPGILAAASVTFSLKNGQRIEAATFVRGDTEVKITTTDGVGITLPLSSLNDPAATWLEESAELEQTGRVEEALDRLRMARRWNPTLPATDRETALMNRLRSDAEAVFLRAYSSGAAEECAAARARLVKLGGPLPPRVAASLQELRRNAEQAVAAGDMPLAHRLYTAYLTICARRSSRSRNSCKKSNSIPSWRRRIA